MKLEEKEPLYYYFNSKGHTLYTPNLEFATVRANKYGTINVYYAHNLDN